MDVRIGVTARQVRALIPSQHRRKDPTNPMKKRSASKLKITVETLRVLSPTGLGAARGGTLVIEPTTAPPTSNKVTFTCPAKQTEYSCGCIG